MTLDDLTEKYPELLKNHGYSSYMPDGWIPMFAKLCDDIHALAVKYGVPRGSEGYPHIAQYKEKFGVLRVYCDCSNPDLRDEIKILVEKASEASAWICSRCGAPGVMHTDETGYYRNFCDPCELAYKKEIRR